MQDSHIVSKTARTSSPRTQAGSCRSDFCGGTAAPWRTILTNMMGLYIRDSRQATSTDGQWWQTHPGRLNQTWDGLRTTKLGRTQWATGQDAD